MGGGVQVFVRVRPTLPRELAFDHAVDPLSDHEVLVYKQDQEFRSAYDMVFPESAAQADVYACLQDKVLAAMDGYNFTIFAYGQTGTGKTFTMMGEHGNDVMDLDKLGMNAFGIVPRAMEDVFRQARTRQDQDGTLVQIIASYMEIYQDRLYDLLQPYKRGVNRDPSDMIQKKAILDVREDAQGNTYVPNLLSVKVKSFKSLLQLISKGNRNRAVRHTEMNVNSSRSHAILQIVVEQWPDGGAAGTVVRSKLNFVDLAGSERWNKQGDMHGDRVNELTAINSSLSALATVVAALTDQARHIPYRDSKLTHLLQDSLGGNCNTTIVATISPSVDAFEESCSTLKFADRARSISNNPVVNTSRDMGSVLALKEREINRLRQMLQQYAAQLKAGEVPRTPNGGLPDIGDFEFLRGELEATKRALDMERALRTELEMKLQRNAEQPGSPDRPGQGQQGEGEEGPPGTAEAGPTADGTGSSTAGRGDISLMGGAQEVTTAFDRMGSSTHRSSPGTPLHATAPYAMQPSSSGMLGGSSSSGVLTRPSPSKPMPSASPLSYDYLRIATPPESPMLPPGGATNTGRSPLRGPPGRGDASRRSGGASPSRPRMANNVQRSRDIGSPASTSSLLGAGGRSASPPKREFVRRSSFDEALKRIKEQVIQLSILDRQIHKQQQQLIKVQQHGKAVRSDGEPSATDKEKLSAEKARKMMQAYAAGNAAAPGAGGRRPAKAGPGAPYAKPPRAAWQSGGGAAPTASGSGKAGVAAVRASHSGSVGTAESVPPGSGAAGGEGRQMERDDSFHRLLRAANASLSKDESSLEALQEQLLAQRERAAAAEHPSTVEEEGEEQDQGGAVEEEEGAGLDVEADGDQHIQTSHRERPSGSDGGEVEGDASGDVEGGASPQPRASHDADDEVVVQSFDVDGEAGASPSRSPAPPSPQPASSSPSPAPMSTNSLPRPAAGGGGWGRSALLAKFSDVPLQMPPASAGTTNDVSSNEVSPVAVAAPAPTAGWGRNALLAAQTGGLSSAPASSGGGGGWGRSALLNSMPAPPLSAQATVPSQFRQSLEAALRPSGGSPPPRKPGSGSSGQYRSHSVGKPRPGAPARLPRKPPSPGKLDAGSWIYILGSRASSVKARAIASALHQDAQFTAVNGLDV